MPRQDMVTTDNTLPIFLFDHADESMQHVPSRLFKATMLIISAIGIGLAITLWLVGPEKMFANVIDISAFNSFFKRDTDQTPVSQSTSADAQVRPSTAADTLTRDRPTREESPATVNVADQSQTEISEAQSSDVQSGALLKQFQTWAAERDAQATPVEAVQPIQDTKAKVHQSDRAPARLTQKHRGARPVENARAQVRPAHRAKARSEQHARTDVQQAKHAQANAQAPSFLQSLGLHN
jgi:hypothetical protein